MAAARPPTTVRLADEEYAEHVADAEERLADALGQGWLGYPPYRRQRREKSGSDERDGAHHSIIEDLYAGAKDVPCERKAILAGGLPGAGKTTILAEHAGIDLTQYLMINPDLIKLELARRNMIPEVEGLSPLEASDLVHEESSYIAKRLASKAEADGKNVIWDVTMSRTDTAIERIESLLDAGYSPVEGIFIDIPIEVSLRRAGARHRKDHDEYCAGNGLGGRYISRATILDHADSAWGSGNRRNFEELKTTFRCLAGIRQLGRRAGYQRLSTPVVRATSRSGPMSSSEVTDLIVALRSGTMTLDEVAERFQAAKLASHEGSKAGQLRRACRRRASRPRSKCPRLDRRSYGGV